MILEKQSQSLIKEEGDVKGTTLMSLDMDSAQVLMQMLSKNLYSDAIGSTVRECASNALDSHRRAGVTSPIIVGLVRNELSQNHEFTVEDFGTGLDASDVENIISKYGKSTKRNSSTELGMMGLGFKAPLAYSSSFYFVCRKDGTERKYMMYEGEDTNSIDLLYETPTKEGNGVKIIIPIKNTDYLTFLSKIKEQLAYFENVYFNTPNIENDFKIYRSEHFQKSDLCSNDKLHVCLDNVYYPLDFEKLGIDVIKVPLGLRFSLTDGIFPTPNREALRYTTEAKATILAKIKTVANDLQTKYNETITELTDIFTIYNYYSSGDKMLLLDDKQFVNVKNIQSFSDISEKIPVLQDSKYFTTDSLYKLTPYMMSNYEKAFKIERYNGRIINLNTWYKSVSFSDIVGIKTNTVYITSRVPSDIKKKYLKCLHDKQEVYIFKKKKDIPLFPEDRGFIRGKMNSLRNMSCYYDLLDLWKLPVHEWRAKIKEYQEFVAQITDNFIDVDTMVVPRWFIDQNKPKKALKTSGPKEVKVKGDISAKVATDLEKWVEGRNCKFVPETFKAELLNKAGHLTVYGLDTDRETLDKWWCVVPKHDAKFVIVSEREKNNIEKYELKSWMHIDEFLKGDNKVIRRTVSAILIRNLYNNSYALRENRDVSRVVNDFQKDANLLYNYSSAHYRRHKETFTDEELQSFVKRGIVDGNIHYLYLKYKNLINKYSFLDILANRLFNQDSHLQVVKDLCRYHKIRMTPECYKITEGWQPVGEGGQLFLFPIAS